MTNGSADVRTEEPLETDKERGHVERLLVLPV